MKIDIFFKILAFISLISSIQLIKTNQDKKLLNDRNKNVMNYVSFNFQVLTGVHTKTDENGSEWKCYKKIKACVKKFKILEKTIKNSKNFSD